MHFHVGQELMPASLVMQVDNPLNQQQSQACTNFAKTILHYIGSLLLGYHAKGINFANAKDSPIDDVNTFICQPSDLLFIRSTVIAAMNQFSLQQYSRSSRGESCNLNVC